MSKPCVIHLIHVKVWMYVKNLLLKDSSMSFSFYCQRQGYLNLKVNDALYLTRSSEYLEERQPQQKSPCILNSMDKVVSV